MKYDPNDKPQGGTGTRTRILAGRYTVTVTSAFYGSDKWTKDNPPEEQAQCLDLELTIASGSHQGRKVWAQYYTEGAVSPGRIKYGQMMVRRLCEALGIYERWESDPLTGECHALRGQSGKCDIGPSSYKPEKDEITEWHAAQVLAHVAPQRPAAPAYDDTQRRNGQVAQVASRPLPAADFDDNVPF